MRPESIYAAGKITKERNRFGIFPSSTDKFVLNQEEPYTYYGYEFIYTGAFTIGCDHGCSHKKFETFNDSTRGSGTHGAASSTCVETDLPPSFIQDRCFNGIARADMVFVWIDSEDCYGTLVEIGYAKALGKPIAIYHSYKVNPKGELWFAFEGSIVNRSSSVREAVEHFHSAILNGIY